MIFVAAVVIDYVVCIVSTTCITLSMAVKFAPFNFYQQLIFFLNYHHDLKRRELAAYLYKLTDAHAKQKWTFLVCCVLFSNKFIMIILLLVYIN